MREVLWLGLALRGIGHGPLDVRPLPGMGMVADMRVDAILVSVMLDIVGYAAVYVVLRRWIG